jgi:hypothetical protein
MCRSNTNKYIIRIDRIRCNIHKIISISITDCWVYPYFGKSNNTYINTYKHTLVNTTIHVHTHLPGTVLHILVDLFACVVFFSFIFPIFFKHTKKNLDEIPMILFDDFLFSYCLLYVGKKNHDEIIDEILGFLMKFCLDTFS